jgi:hypothetical protein
VPPLAGWEFVMRHALTLLAPLALVLVAVTPVNAAPPTFEPQEPLTADFAAGEVCDFNVRVETLAISSKSITFDRHDEAFRQILSGRIVLRIANAETGASVDRNSSGPGKVSINDAGHIVLRFGGSSVLPFFDGDVTGRGLFDVKGGGAEFEIGDDGFFFIRAVFPAHVEDLCATLT